MKVTLVPEENIPEAWPYVKSFLARAIARSKGRHTLATTWFNLKRGRYSLWVMFEDGFDSICAAAVTCITMYPAKEVLCVVLIGGRRMKDWADAFHDTLLRYAGDLNLDEIELFGRPGWQRIGRRYGWSGSLVFLTRDLRQEIKR